VHDHATDEGDVGVGWGAGRGVYGFGGVGLAGMAGSSGLDDRSGLRRRRLLGPSRGREGETEREGGGLLRQPASPGDWVHRAGCGKGRQERGRFRDGPDDYFLELLDCNIGGFAGQFKAGDLSPNGDGIAEGASGLSRGVPIHLRDGGAGREGGAPGIGPAQMFQAGLWAARSLSICQTAL
jgi:hypothetical protein